MIYTGKDGAVGGENSWCLALGVLVVFLAVSGCFERKQHTGGGEQRSTPVATVPKAPAATHPPGSGSAIVAADAKAPGISCEILVEGSFNQYRLSLKLSNSSGEDVSLRYHHPMSFALDAWVAERPIEVVVPSSDMPVQPRTISVPAGGTATLSTPVSLRFGRDVKPHGGDSPFLWTLRHDRADVRLRATRAFDGKPKLTCTGLLQSR